MKIGKKIVVVGIILIIFTVIVFFYVFNTTETVTLYPVADTFVHSDIPSRNWDDMFLIYISRSPDSIGGQRENAYLLFNLTTLDNDVFAIKSATLQLHTYWSLKESQVGVHLCSDTRWREFELTWLNAPPFSSEPIDVKTIVYDNKWYSWDVTEEVQKSQEGYLTLVLTVESEGAVFGTHFESKENRSNKPRLVIIYGDNP
jgi:hypothetical protein